MYKESDFCDAVREIESTFELGKKIAVRKKHAIAIKKFMQYLI